MYLIQPYKEIMQLKELSASVDVALMAYKETNFRSFSKNNTRKIPMSPYMHRIVLTALITFSASAAWAQATADKRPPGTDLKPGNHYCVKNAESGVCEDCWSGSKTSSQGGSCKLLKESTNDPNVRKGKCSDVINTDFCKPKAMSH